MCKWLQRLFGLDSVLGTLDVSWPEERDKPYISNFIVEKTDPVLSHSLAISGTFYRFHDRRSAPPATPLWRTFLDSDAKWESKGRYAGENLNCGHFFALSNEGARAEAAHYEVDLETADLIEVDLSLEKILDLSAIEAIHACFRTLTSKPDASDSFMAEEMIEEDTGGTVLTDRVGHWASHNDYNGVLFYGARVIHGPDVKHKEGVRPRAPWSGSLLAFELEALREMNQLNMVVFRGLYLLGRIRRYRANSGDWNDNEYFGKSEEEIDASLKAFPEYAKFDLDFQARQGRIYFSGKIQYQDN